MTIVKTRGSLKPDLEITISDAAGLVDFSGASPAGVHVIGEMEGLIIFDEVADGFVVAGDGKSAVVSKVWDAADVDTVGHLWVRVRVTWSGSAPQYFPESGPLRIDIVRQAGDA